MCTALPRLDVVRRVDRTPDSLDIDAVATFDPTDGVQSFLEVVSGVEEHDRDAIVDSHRQVDHDGVLHRGQHAHPSRMGRPRPVDRGERSGRNDVDDT